LTEEAPLTLPAASDPTGGVKGKRKSKKDKLREAAAREQGAAAEESASVDVSSIWKGKQSKR
jgi:hypothetical protein